MRECDYVKMSGDVGESKMLSVCSVTMFACVWKRVQGAVYM
jgi:hypothetical protein